MVKDPNTEFSSPLAAAATGHGAGAPDLSPYTENRGFFGHPRGLSTLFFTEMWERFSYYGLRPLLVLFMAAALAEGGFGFDRAQASAIVGIYGAFVYVASLPGGWIADRWLGLQRAIFIGAILITLVWARLFPELRLARTFDPPDLREAEISQEKAK